MNQNIERYKLDSDFKLKLQKQAHALNGCRVRRGRRRRYLTPTFAATCGTSGAWSYHFNNNITGYFKSRKCSNSSKTHWTASARSTFESPVYSSVIGELFKPDSKTQADVDTTILDTKFVAEGIGAT